LISGTETAISARRPYLEANEVDSQLPYLGSNPTLILYRYIVIYIYMAMSIKSADAEALARKVSAMTGETLTAAIVTALRERLHRLQRMNQHDSLADQLNAIAERSKELPVIDQRSADEIIGYNDHGVPR
jgi:antitoxin VapB